MPISDIIFCSVRGAGIVYFLAIGLYLLLFRRSIFTENRQNWRLRRHAGVAMLCWSASYLVGLSIYVLCPSEPSLADNLCILFDFVLCGPSTMLMIHTVTRFGHVKYATTVIHSVVGLTFVLLYLLIVNDLIVYLALLYWFLAICHFAFTFVVQTKAYTAYIESEYSNLSHLSARWLYHSVWFVVVNMIIYVLSRLLHNSDIMMLSFFVTTGALTFVVYNIERQVVISAEDALSCQDNMISTPRNKDVLTVEESGTIDIEMLLRERCEEKSLFLQLDLTVDELASNVGVNRSILCKYFSSKGLNFHSYVNALRVQYSKKLLSENPKMSIREVSKSSGFGSESSFRRVFVDLIGRSPSQFSAQYIK